MSKYEIMKTIDIDMLVKNGIISIFLYTKFKVYEKYTSNLSNMNKAEAIIDVMEEYKISLATFYNYINEMEIK